MSNIVVPVRVAKRPDIPGAAIVLAILIVTFAATAPGFASLANAANVLSQASILLIIALPMTFIIITEGLDLSAGAVTTLAAVALSLAVIGTGSVPLAILVALAVGGAIGAINGCLVAFAGLPPFVATLGVMGVAQGLSLIVTGGQTVIGIPAAIQNAYSGVAIGIPVPIMIAGILFAAMWMLLYRTRFGTYVFALGGNREALTLAARPIRLLLTIVYLIGGLCSGLAALLMVARMNSGHPTAGIGMEFEAIAAVAIGGTSFAHGQGTLFGTLMGVVTVGVLRNGLNLLGVSSSLQVAAVGAMVILALLIETKRSAKP